MSPIEESPQRYFHIQMKPVDRGGPWPEPVCIRADMMCQPDQKKVTKFKIGSELVAEVKGEIASWRVEERLEEEES